jgi:hypothetical protein
MDALCLSFGAHDEGNLSNDVMQKQFPGCGRGMNGEGCLMGLWDDSKGPPLRKTAGYARNTRSYRGLNRTCQQSGKGCSMNSGRWLWLVVAVGLIALGIAIALVTRMPA